MKSRNNGLCHAALAPRLAVCLAMFVTGGSLHAQDELSDDDGPGTLSGNLKLSSDYMFRGISNTDNGPQIQGDVTWAFDNGIYVGVWSSNTEFGGDNNSLEIDPYVGFASSIGDTGLSYNVGFWSYNYPGSRSDLDGDGDTESASFDYWELYAILGYSIGKFTVSPSVWYADNYFGDDALDDVSSVAYDVTVSYALPQNFSVSARVGRQTFDETPGLVDIDYSYYDAGVSYTIRSITFDLRYFDTNGIRSALVNPNLADSRWVYGATYAF